MTRPGARVVPRGVAGEPRSGGLFRRRAGIRALPAGVGSRRLPNAYPVRVEAACRSSHGPDAIPRRIPRGACGIPA